MFYLNNNVYIVKGRTRACIYDLNGQNLYNISKKFADFLQNISAYRYIPNSIFHSDSMQELIEKKIIISEDRDLFGKIEVEKQRPKRGTIEITQRCNFKCIHCFEGKHFDKIMDLADIKRIIDEFEKFGIRSIRFFGGEPFMHPDICEILYYANGKFDSMAITTNASILNEKIEKCLQDVDPLILASFHSDIESEFDRVTNTSGMYEIVKKNIERMKRLSINCQVRKVSIQGIKSTERYEENLNEYSGFPILIGNAGIEQYSAEMLKKKVINDKFFEKKLDVKSILLNMNYQRCYSRNIYVDVDQNVYPCVMERRIMHGNIVTSSLIDVFDDGIIRMTKDSIQECKDCEYRYACNTCFVDNRSECVYDKPWFCLYNPYTGKWEDEENWIREIVKSK